MKVILLADVQGHGKRGAVVDVNDGYARNYLIPKKLAKEATKAVLNEYNHKLEKEARLAKEEKEAALQLLQHLSSKKVTVKVRCGEDGKMYGSVTSQDIADALLEQEKITVDKKKITIKEPIKAVGVYEVEVWVYPETIAKVKLNVVAGK
ncbi:MAG: 50S ribosomal protein L9 [Clostridia bacterium]